MRIILANLPVCFANRFVEASARPARGCFFNARHSVLLDVPQHILDSIVGGAGIDRLDRGIQAPFRGKKIK